jgi:oligopeptide/dipeptide ABC transporter ATP-binding protein
MTESAALISARDLTVEFSIRNRGGRQRFRAVNGVSLDVARGEILALVGESGCGKSTLGRALLRVYKPAGGSITFDGTEIARASTRQLRPLRRRLQMIFQHPAAALNPRVVIWRSIAEPLDAQGEDRKRSRAAALAMLERVGLPAAFGARYPHELSGGQLQRVAIARALVGKPDFIVADEPLSSLDLSVQAQVMMLLKELQAEFGVALLFITHDLAAAEYLSDRVAVMYLGKLVEVAPAARFSRNARHPYSKGLINSIPRMDPVAERARKVELLVGEVPSPVNPPTGCQFHTRCPVAIARCKSEEPNVRTIADGHSVACWLV